MCGIAGIIKIRGSSPDPTQLQNMLATIAHRGPDESNWHCNGSAGLAHTRLSIIDLQGGQQPMTTADHQLWITFNGEIFNYIELREELLNKGHRFATRSDTEVLLHLYQEEGEDCVHRLNGQWAFAIWDAKKQKLFLSRDRLGVRPLFYTLTADRLVFASEIKSVFAGSDLAPELDLQALDEIFTFWIMLPPRTAFRNVQQLPPGYSLVFENGQIRTYQYWSLDYNLTETADEKHLDEDLFDLLLDATRLRLRSDVPVGAYLSGGLDSTVITALTHRLVGDRLRTFSVSFEDTEFDESRYQREASEFLHTQHTDVSCTYQDIASVFPNVVWHSEQPIVRTAPAPLFLLSKLVRESGYKVVLTGEGADEMFGGYDIFKEAKIRRFWGRNLASRWRPALLKRLYPYMGAIQRQPASYLQSFFHVRKDELADPFFSHLPRWELTSKLKALLSDDVRAELKHTNCYTTLEHELPESFASWAPFNQAEYLEAMYLLPGYILSSQGDRMAMAHSVEGRYPFLDHRVVRFATKLPPTVKMKVLNQKYLLKTAFAKLIPESIRKRYKQPYRAPDARSFLNSNPDYLEDMLAEDQIRRTGVFDAPSVAAMMSKFRSVRAISVKDNMALVGILSTQLLLHQFNHNLRGSLCNQGSPQMSAASS